MNAGILIGHYRKKGLANVLQMGDGEKKGLLGVGPLILLVELDGIEPTAS